MTVPQIDTELLWVLTLLFLGLAVVYLVSVFVFRNRISSTSEKSKERKKELSPMISQFLFHEEDADTSEKSLYIDLKIQIRELLKDKFNRKVLTEVLLDLQKDVSGDTKKRLFDLYQDLGLHKDAFEKLQSWRWEVIAKGIEQLTEMQVESAYGFIAKFINDRRPTVRKQAEIGIVSLRPEGIVYFLDTTRYKISEWQQLKLLDVLRNREYFEPPRFKLWLTSTNRHVVLFALRLIKYYNQNDANASLIELLKHKNGPIKLEAVGCIKEFYVVEALPVLKKVFYQSGVDTKIAILGAIGELGTGRDIDFLKTVAQREGNFSVKSKALAAINTIAPETVMPTEGIDSGAMAPVEGDRDESLSRPNTEAGEETTEDAAPTGLIADLSDGTGKEKPVSRMEATDDEEVPSRLPEPERPINIDFLPIVTLSGPIQDQASNNDNSMKDPENTGADILQIEVCYEEIQVAPPKVATSGKPKFDIEEISFLPIVVEGEEESDEEGEGAKNRLSNDVDELDFFPLDASVDLSDGIEGYGLDDFEVDFVKAGNEDTDGLPDFELEEEPYTIADEGNEDDVLTWLLVQNELNEIEVEYEEVSHDPASGEAVDLVIPEPVYYNPHEAYMMGLLDDLEEMGDYREIPLLEELLAGESKKFIKERIQGMITIFSKKRDGHVTIQKNYVEELNLPVFSVFADLFKNIDREAKLILLDEVVAVGDEKEIPFLDGLLECPDIEIREKAQGVLKLLLEKVAHDKKIEEDKKKEREDRLTKALFDRQMAKENPGVDYTEDEFHQLLDEMDIEASADPEIFEIDFELEEVLDKVHDKEILNMPVIATEVSPNGASFLFQFYQFQRNFMCKLNG